MQLKRVVITGLGAISPMGVGVEALRSGLAAGRSSTVSMRGEWKHFRNMHSLVAAPGPDLDERRIPRQNRRSMSRMSFYGHDAARQALADAFGDGSSWSGHFSPGRLGCIIGSTTGSPIALNRTFEMMLPERDIAKLDAVKFFQCVSHTVAMNVAQCLGITGTVLATNSACASGLQAVGAACDLIRLGRQDAVLCGGAEELHPSVTGSFDVLFAASSRFNDAPSETPRPFDRDRDGIVCGEGAGILLLEDFDHALARGAKMYAEVSGYHTCASGEHISQSSRAALIRCLQEALDSAGAAPEEIDYVNAHAAGTLQGDAEEAAALREIFGDRVPVSSLKGHIGHTLGASGPIELIATLLMMRDSVLYPTLHLRNPAAECEGLRHVTSPISRPIGTFIKNSFAFGGINAALVCRNII
ncbi:MAG: beta-ketoacyl-[acyl-carrier-protein] synthase family protein [Terrimicrobiaceae bacterium]